MTEPLPYSPFNNIILRTPLFPIGFAKELTQKEEVSDEEITALCKNPVISEAIYIASPTLYYEMQKWIYGSSALY